MTTYQSEAVPTAGVLRLIEDAQRTLNEHAADLNGTCVTCHVTSPCAHREPAVAMLLSLLPGESPETATGHAARLQPTPVEWFRNERQPHAHDYDNRKATAYDAAQ